MQPILIVDDDRTLLSLYTVMLRHYPLLLAASGGEALGILQRETPSLILLDIAMPDVSGYEILHNVRSDTRLAATKIIIVTAVLARVDDTRMALADVVLVKPITKRQVETAIKEVLGW